MQRRFLPGSFAIFPNTGKVLCFVVGWFPIAAEGGRPATWSALVISNGALINVKWYSFDTATTLEEWEKLNGPS
jgi:hypothetical protein